MTKYPLLWPGVLAGVIAGAEGDRLTGPLVVLPNAVLLPLALLAFAVILARSWRLPTAATAFLVLALGLNPSVLELARFPMSETLYLALTLGAIALADTGPDRPSLRRDALAACLAVAALHTRLAGVALVIALAMAFAARRRFRACALTFFLATVSLSRLLKNPPIQVVRATWREKNSLFATPGVPIRRDENSFSATC